MTTLDSLVDARDGGGLMMDRKLERLKARVLARAIERRVFEGDDPADGVGLTVEMMDRVLDALPSGPDAYAGLARQVYYAEVNGRRFRIPDGAVSIRLTSTNDGSRVTDEWVEYRVPNEMWERCEEIPTDARPPA